MSRLSNDTLAADVITYTLNDTVGALTVTGTITTDGHIGFFPTSASDILNWNLTITNGTTSQALLGPLSPGTNSFIGGLSGPGGVFSPITRSTLLATPNDLIWHNSPGAAFNIQTNEINLASMAFQGGNFSLQLSTPVTVSASEVLTNKPFVFAAVDPPVAVTGNSLGPATTDINGFISTRLETDQGGDPPGGTSTANASTITLFNDFGLGNTYESFQAAPISGSSSSFGYHDAAMAFTAPNSANVTQIDIGLTTITPGNAGANVSLAIDNGGKLGRTLKTWSVTTSAPFGTAFDSVTTISDIKGVHLKAGDSYYLLLTPMTSTTFDDWNINNISFDGTRLVSPLGLQVGVPLSAFAIFGRPTPPVDAVPGPDLGAGLPGHASTMGISDTAHLQSPVLFNQYMASSFVTPGDGRSGPLINDLPPTEHPLLAHPHA